ncbi:hypothetical protein BB560_001192 [Smittium megazygosporum]|uniref:Uncharacterized protein n=1 Tax=Smittium megazygosporum TaxID=133381 RepID=A0A2T9ZI75_9FUNG|nr:hypothetical protein BB560_001193 [Smittium megazygosporum]PVV04307.1 hypothetical protein BB560_001192 [Smittium megazygosporum]
MIQQVYPNIHCSNHGKLAKLLKIGQKSNTLDLVACLHPQNSLKDFGNFQRTSKRTDVCNVYVAGDQYKVELDSMVRSGNIDIFRMATLQRLMVKYNDHMELNRRQRAAFKTQQENLEGSFCVLIADFKEGFKIGGGPVESNSSFYEKIQIFLSLFLQFIGTRRPSTVQNRHLWIDSDPHFKNSLGIIAVFSQFPRIFSQKNLTLNFFFENHGKSDVYSHFGVLSIWFSHAEAHQNINTITELKECFKTKAHADSLTRGNGNAGKYNFKVYPRDVPRSERYQVKIKDGIKLFLSYIFIEGKLIASSIYSEDLASYNPVAYKETKISDKSSNKYASDHIQRGSSGNALMRPSYIEIQTKRVGMLRGVRGGGERERFLSNGGNYER